MAHFFNIEQYITTFLTFHSISATYYLFYFIAKYLARAFTSFVYLFEKALLALFVLCIQIQKCKNRSPRSSVATTLCQYDDLRGATTRLDISGMEH